MKRLYVIEQMPYTYLLLMIDNLYFQICTINKINKITGQTNFTDIAIAKKII